MFALVTLVSIASAEEPATVFHAGDPASAVVAVERGTDRPPWEIVPRLLVDATAPDRVAAFGAGAGRACEEGTTAASVRARLAAAEAAVAAAAWGDARPLLVATLDAAECLREPVEASVLGRAALLLGVANGALGDASDVSFARALAFQPGLAWDSTFPSAGKATFDATVQGLATARTGQIVLGPGAEVTTLWVNGRPVPVQAGAVTVPAGRHLVQFVQAQVITLPIDVTAGSTIALASPPRIPPAAATTATEASTRAYLAPYLAASATGPTYVWTGAELLDVRAGMSAVPLRARQVKKRSPVAPALLFSGIGLVGVGAVSTVVGLVTYSNNADGEPGEADEDYAQRIIAAGAGAGMATMGLTACGIGLVSIGVSIPLGQRAGGGAR